MTLTHAGLRDAAFVWPAVIVGTRQVFVSFRRCFALDKVDTSAQLQLFADTRYRLWVNGALVATGPARFVPTYPEYDTVTLAPWLRTGDNELLVEVNDYGCSSYHSMPESRGGFWARGRVGEHDLTTPGSWEMRVETAWEEDAPLFSFAQNAVEVCDLRRRGEGDAEAWLAVERVPASEAPWGEPVPRSVPMAPLRAAKPATLEARGALADDELVMGFRIPSQARNGAAETTARREQVFVLHIEAPRAMQVRLGLFWGQFWLNGERVEVEKEGDRNNRREVSLALQAGSNVFCGVIEQLSQTEVWDVLFGWPRDAGLRFAAHADGRGADAFRLSPLLEPDEAETWLADGRPVERDGWTICPVRTAVALTPARVMAWDRWARAEEAPGPWPRDGEPLQSAASNYAWVFGFAHEYVGHVELDIEASAGTVVDVGYDEWRRDDGMIDIYRTNPFVHTVDRYILREGRQRVLGFYPRGGRYVQVTVRAAAAAKAVLHGIRILETRTLEAAGGFAGGPAVWGDIWRASVATLVGSTEEAYSDSPWRERGTYVGDFWVNQQVHRLLSPDLRIARRGLRVFAQAQLEDGQIPCVAPAHLRKPHEDFSLIWVLAVRDHWALTGDVALVKEVWSALERLWASRSWEADTTGLWAGEGKRMFIDWGALPEEREGQANAVLNAFRLKALAASAELARAWGREDLAEAFASAERRLRAVFVERLWDEQAQRFAAARTFAEDQLFTTPAVHANALAWTLRLGDERQQAAVEQYVFDALARNYTQGCEAGQASGHMELYFLAWVLPHLAMRGQAARAEALITETWGPLVEDGFGTLPECFCRRQQGIGSRCHSWSGFPAVYFTRDVLGLRQAVAGDPDRWVFDPRVSDAVEGAEGELPHARGMMEARWWREADGTIRATVKAPTGVEVAVDERVRRVEAE